MLLLRTIPGVGIRTAETIAAYMDNAKRFLRSAQVGAYFGLVPCQDASAGVNRLGHITRQGPATARQYLVEAAWQGMYRSPTIRAYFERVQHGRPEDRQNHPLTRPAALWYYGVMFGEMKDPFSLTCTALSTAAPRRNFLSVQTIGQNQRSTWAVQRTQSLCVSHESLS